jgi:2-methylaconitate cis-trans-isomerase PrpF
MMASRQIICRAGAALTRSVGVTTMPKFKSIIGLIGSSSSSSSSIYNKNKNMNMNNHKMQMMNYISTTFTSGPGGRRRRRRRIKITYVLQRGGTSKGIFFHKDDLPDCPKLRYIVIQDIFGSPDIRQIDGLGGADVLTSKVAIINKRNNKSKDNNNNSNIDDNTIVFADVDYVFGQVEFGSGDDENENSTSTASAKVLYDVNCGDISAGVGTYAIEEGLIEVNDETVTATKTTATTTTNDHDDNTQRYNYHQKVRIYNVNTNKIIVSEAPVEKINIQQKEQHQQSNKANTTTTSTNSQHTSSRWIVIEDGTYQIDGVLGPSAYLPLDFQTVLGQ